MHVLEKPKPLIARFRALLSEYIAERIQLQHNIDNDYFDLERVKSVELLEMLLPFRRGTSIRTLRVTHRNSWK